MNDVRWKEITKALRVFEKHGWVVDKCEFSYDIGEGNALRLNLLYSPPVQRAGFGE